MYQKKIIAISIEYVCIVASLEHFYKKKRVVRVDKFSKKIIAEMKLFNKGYRPWRNFFSCIIHLSPFTIKKRLLIFINLHHFSKKN